MPIQVNKLKTIIPFDMIVDIDYGLIRMINKRYHNSDTFYSSLLSLSDKNLVYLLYSRKNENPLSIIMKDKDEEIMSSYYDQFMEQEYVNILVNSCTTSIYNLIKLSVNTDSSISNTILCSSELEKSFLLRLDKETFSKCEIIVNKLDELSLADYSIIYIKNYKDAVKSFREIIGKNIYIAGYGFNLEDNGNELNKNFTSIFRNANIIKTVGIYDIDESYIPKG